MKELFSLLDMRERRLVSRLGAVLGVLACLLVFLAVRTRSSAHQAVRALAAAEIQAKTIQAERETVRTSRQAWTEAEKDMAKLRGAWLFDAKDAARSLRMDLEKIFEASGIAANDISYGYAAILGTRMEKVVVEFRFSGNYAILKRLLDTVERHPRLLLVEKIDFLNIGRVPGVLELKVGLAGYYEN
jgi:hypothetical protein